MKLGDKGGNLVRVASQKFGHSGATKSPTPFSWTRARIRAAGHQADFTNPLEGNNPINLDLCTAYKLCDS